MSLLSSDNSPPPVHEIASMGRKAPILGAGARRAGMRVTAGLLDWHGLDSLEAIESGVAIALARLGDYGSDDPIFEHRLLEVAAAHVDPTPRSLAALTPANEAQAIRNLLHVCVHPALPPDRQRSLLLRFAFWLPNEASAKILETGAATIGMHLRQSFRRLRAIARRGDAAGISRKGSRGGILLEHFAGFRRRAREMQRRGSAPSGDVDGDVRAFATVLADTEGGPSRGEAHAFLAELLLGEERAARKTEVPVSVSLQGVEADPASDRLGRGLRHLMAAQELGVDSRFVWLARIHATYLLESDTARIDWQRLVGLYERLIEVGARREDLGSRI